MVLKGRIKMFKKILIIVVLIFSTFYVYGEVVPIFDIPVQVSPGNVRTVLVPSYSPTELNLDNFYEKSKETGLYPTWGWTGEYYETGVTHGSVIDNYSPSFDRGGYNSSFIDSSRSVSTIVPEPSSITAGILFFVLYLLRRKKSYA